MNRPEYILNEVRKETDSVILFTSLTGKDSILLTHYCAQIFARVVCVYMYVVKGLSYALKYQKYFEGRFTNLNYLHVPHFALASYIKNGYMGIASDTKQKRITLAAQRYINQHPECVKPRIRFDIIILLHFSDTDTFKIEHMMDAFVPVI